MEGFPSPKIGKGISINPSGSASLYFADPWEENEKFRKAGYIIDEENEVYVKEGLGAFYTNVDKDIKSIDDLRNYIDKITKANPYEEAIRLIDEEGYEFVLGPGAPDGEFLTGLYCKNYKEIAAREKKKAAERDEEER